ncbi:MAG: hypothetical protein ACRDG4_04970 [Chloroflexota bacterium]
MSVEVVGGGEADCRGEDLGLVGGQILSVAGGGSVGSLLHQDAVAIVGVAPGSAHGARAGQPTQGVRAVGRHDIAG